MPDEKGHYPYTVAAYRMDDDNEWHIGPFPVPFDETLKSIQDSGIVMQTVHQVGLEGAVADLSSLAHYCPARAFKRGWNQDFEDAKRWHPPGENIPMPDIVPNLEDCQILLNLIAIAGYWIELQVRQDEKRQHIIIEPTTADILPGLAFLLKSLINNGYGHMTLVDSFERFFFRINVWGNQDGTSYMLFQYDGDDAKDIRWIAKTNTQAIITNIKEFLLSVANHPDFLSEYIYNSVCTPEDMQEELDMATKAYLATPVELRKTPPRCVVHETEAPLLLDPFDDEENDFRRQWLRENLLGIESARQLHEKYQQMLRELLIPEGWLDLPVNQDWQGCVIT